MIKTGQLKGMRYHLNVPHLIEGGNYSNTNFIFGDVQDGLSGAAGEYLNVLLGMSALFLRRRRA